MTPKQADAKTVKGFLSGDREAAKQVDAYIDAAYRTWRDRFGYESDDIRSDILFKLYNSLQNKQFRFGSSLATYINRIVNHTCVDYWRFNQRVRTEDLESVNLTSADPNAEQKLEKKQLAKIIFRVLRLVPRECLRLWRWHLKEGLTCGQIGEKLGKSEGNIRRQLWACREKAREFREKMIARDKLF